MITNDEFNRVVVYMKQKCGINLSSKKILIQGRLENYLRKNHYASLTEFMDLVDKFPDGKEAQILMNALTTNHTYFWRENDQFIFLKEKVFPYLKEKNMKTKDWRIWCAASSSGEEPYTLAMLCMDYFGMEHSQWDTKILATDIDTNVLNKAVTGVYQSESVENLPESYVRRFFKKINDKEYEVRPELKNEVIFRQFNLMSPLPFKKPLQVVFLRNVMIYFDDSTKEALLNRIYQCLEPGGYLFIGSTESLNQNHGKFQYVQPSIYRK